MVGGAVLFTIESVMESVITTGVAVAVTGPGRTVAQKVLAKFEVYNV